MCFKDVLNETPTYQKSVLVAADGSWHQVLDNTLLQPTVYWYLWGWTWHLSFRVLLPSTVIKLQCDRPHGRWKKIRIGRGLPGERPSHTF